MKLAIIVGFLFFSPTMMKAQDQPMDIPTLEILIDWHKQKYNKLSDRALREAAKLGVSSTTKTLSEQYEQLHKEITSRYTSYLAWGSLALDAISLAKEVKDSFTEIQTFSVQVRYITNIYVVREYLTALEGIRTQCTYIAATIKRIPLLHANAQEISQMIWELKSRVSVIRQYLSNCNFMVQGYISLQKMGYNRNPVDKAKIAVQIIKDYGK